MLPILIHPNEMYSQQFENEFADGKRHLVCMIHH